MSKKMLTLKLLFLATLVIWAPSVWAMTDTDMILMTLVIAGVSLLAYWFASVLMMFGLSFLLAFLAGYVFLFVSFLIGDYFSRELMEHVPHPAQQQAPAASKHDPLRGMNLS